MTIGSNIKKLRTGQGLTQDQLGERLHVTRQTISNWERGTSQPDLTQLEAIAAALGVEVTELLYGPAPRFRVSRKRILWAVGLLLLAGILWAVAGLWFAPKMGTWYLRGHHLVGWYLYRCLYLSVTVLLTTGGCMTLVTALAPVRLEGRARRVCLGTGGAFALVSLLGWAAFLTMVFTPWSPPHRLFLVLAFLDQRELAHVALAFGGVFLFLALDRSGHCRSA